MRRNLIASWILTVLIIRGFIHPSRRRSLISIYNASSIHAKVTILNGIGENYYVTSQDKNLEVNRSEVCERVIHHIKSENQSIYKDKGVHFLYYNHRISFAIPLTQLTVSALDVVHVPILNCFSFTEHCDISFHARLIGTDAIRSARVLEQQSNGDFIVQFTAPPVIGVYNLSVVVRWWHGSEDPHRDSSSYFLGSLGSLNFKQTEDFRRGEEACIIYGSPVMVSVVGSIAKERSQLDFCTTINNPGYWERVNQSNTCSLYQGGENEEHKGECFVLDEVNPQWLWRGDDCRFRFLDPDHVITCLANTTILIDGDSLSSEFFHNLIHYVPNLTEHAIWKSQGRRFVFDGISLDGMESWKKKVFYVSDFQVAHEIWHHPISHLENVLIPKIEKEWKRITETIHNSSTGTEVHGIYYAGYPPFFERKQFITSQRMAKANALLGRALRNLSFAIVDTSIPLSSRPDASWDGLHFLQARERVGGASKMITMMLLHEICNV